MSTLFGRVYEVTVGQRRYHGQWPDAPGLRCSFSISKSLTKEPNTAKVVLYNLSKESRESLQPACSTGRRDKVTIVAGYAGASGVLYSGDVRYVDSTRQGADWVTTITAGDGEAAYQTAKFNLAFGPGSSVADVLRAAAGRLGVGVGNLKEALTQPFRGGVTTYRRGFSAVGDAAEVMDAVARSAGLEMSVQDGQLVLLRNGQVLGEAAFVLGPATGMVGSPQYGTPEAADARKGVPPRLKVKSLLQPLLGCGRAVKLTTAAYAKGLYRVEKVTHTGDTHDTPWYSDVELRLVP